MVVRYVHRMVIVESSAWEMVAASKPSMTRIQLRKSSPEWLCMSYYRSAPGIPLQDSNRYIQYYTKMFSEFSDEEGRIAAPRRFSMIRLPIMLKLERRTGVSKNASRFDAVEAVRRLSNKFPIPSTGFHIFVKNIHRRGTWLKFSHRAGCNSTGTRPL